MPIYKFHANDANRESVFAICRWALSCKLASLLKPHILNFLLKEEAEVPAYRSLGQAGED